MAKVVGLSLHGDELLDGSADRSIKIDLHVGRGERYDQGIPALLFTDRAGPSFLPPPGDGFHTNHVSSG